MELDKRYDIGIVNAQGYGVIAARQLIEDVQQKAEQAGREIPLCTLTDLDIDGMGIAVDANKSDKLSSVDEFGATRIGIRSEHVDEFGLRVESKEYSDKQLTGLENRHEEGAVPDEVYEFLTDNQRVELNAMGPAEFEQFMEQWCREEGLTKVEPKEEDVEVFDAPDLEETKESATKEALADFVLSQTRADLADWIDSREQEAAVDEKEEAREELETLPIGDDAQETMHEEVLDDVADLPPKGWPEINRELVRDLREKTKEHTDAYYDARVNGVTELLRDNWKITVERTDNDSS